MPQRLGYVGRVPIQGLGMISDKPLASQSGVEFNLYHDVLNATFMPSPSINVLEHRTKLRGTQESDVKIDFHDCWN